MALRGRPPEKVAKRLKALFFGLPGAGKTTAALQFPKPYLFDTERGAENDQYVTKLRNAGGAYLFLTDPAELIVELRSLLSEQHPYQTVVIDPLTVIYNDLVDRSAERNGTEFGRHKMEADRAIRHVLQLLVRLDMNVIITSHSKSKWVRVKDAKGKDTVIEEGQTFDCYGKLEYLFDLVFEVQKRGNERVGIVRKTRMETFPDGDTFLFSYDEISRRYGKDVLERGVKPVKLATQEQVDEMTFLLDSRKDADLLKEKWLEKAGAETFQEMTAEQAAKCIEYLSARKAVSA